MFLGQISDLVIINLTITVVEPILHRVVQFSRKIDCGSVGQMPTVRETHPKHRVTRFHERHIDRRVGAGTGMRLNINVCCAEQQFCSINGELFCNIDVAAAPVVTFSRIPFSVLVGKNRPLRLQHPSTGVIL